MLIRRDLRDHVHAFYAFARNADDIADSPVLAPEDKIARLDVMEDVLLGRSDGGSPSAVRLRASLATTGTTPVPCDRASDRFPPGRDEAAVCVVVGVVEYCRYSAMPVGRHVLDLHGESHDTWEPSDALCTSLQVLNHLQDCARDLEALDRSYLPEDMLAANGETVETVRRSRETPGLRAVFDSLLDRVDALNRAALALPRRTRDRRLRLETGVIVELAHHLTRRLRRHDPIAARVKLTKGDVGASVLRALRFLP